MPTEAKSIANYAVPKRKEFTALTRRPHLKKRYWGRHIWARGYFCASVGTLNEEHVKAYIENHDKEPVEQSFSIEDDQA